MKDEKKLQKLKKKLQKAEKNVQTAEIELAVAKRDCLGVEISIETLERVIRMEEKKLKNKA